MYSLSCWFHCWECSFQVSKKFHPAAVKIFTVFWGSEVMAGQAALSCPLKLSSEAACHEEREHNNIMHNYMYGGLSVYANTYYPQVCRCRNFHFTKRSAHSCLWYTTTACMSCQLQSAVILIYIVCDV